MKPHSSFQHLSKLRRLEKKLRYNRRLQKKFRNNPWQYSNPRTPLPIYPLVSPLRYDILIRLDYLRFFAENCDLFSGDFYRYVELTKEHPYYRWFSQVSKRGRRLERADPTLRDAAYAQLLQRIALLFHSFQERGFDPKTPIPVVTGDFIRSTTTGKMLRQRYFACNGSHRLALLLFFGQDILLPGMYVVKRFRAYTPLDNTLPLLRALRVTEAQYFSFLSIRYAQGRTFSTREALFSWVRENDPKNHDELQSLVTRDGEVFH